MPDPQEEDFVPKLPVPDTEEIRKLSEHFKQKYKEEPGFIVRVPGRVNIIGEHVDYSGFPVCPMAIKQHILAAVRLTPESVVQFTNVDSSYEDCTVSVADLKKDIQLTGPPKWYQYFMCGIRGVLETLQEDEPEGLMVAVLGTIPPAAGLSSSSALVSAAVIAAAQAYDLYETKVQLAELAARSERYIGTQGGGMDQAIAFLATQGSAKYIEFNPLRCKEIVLPKGAVFVVAHSLTKMNKAATADFNERVVECRLFTWIMANRMRLDWRRFRNLKSLQLAVGLGLRHLLALACETFHPEPYSKRDLCYELQMKDEVFREKCLSKDTQDMESFKLRQRLYHVVQEADRVENFVRLCKESQSGKESDEAALWKIGRLMKQSHESLRDLYECSHEDLDEIVKLAEKHSLGARLTGAGWGGCTVALTTADKADEYIKVLKEQYYSKKTLPEGQKWEDVCFVTEPGQGAAIYMPNLYTNGVK